MQSKHEFDSQTACRTHLLWVKPVQLKDHGQNQHRPNSWSRGSRLLEQRFNSCMLQVTETDAIDLHRLNVPDLQKIILHQPRMIGCYRSVKIESYRPPEVERLSDRCVHNPSAICLLGNWPPTTLKCWQRE